MEPPRRGTPRDRSRRSRGVFVERVAATLGVPLLPWTRHVARVAGEVADDGHRYRYRTVVVRAPRRSTKTTLVLATLLARAGELPGRRCFYTAQDRDTAARLYREEWDPMLAGSPLARELDIRRSNGSERIRWRRAGSTVALFAPGPRAIHSSDADTVVVDESSFFGDVRGRQLEQAIRPAQSHVSRTAQLWIVSAGGTHESTWLHRWLAVSAPDVAIFDYSADPDVDDLDDPATLARVHPGIGHVVDAATLWADRESMSRAEWARAYLAVSTGEPARARTLAYDGPRFAELATTDLDTAGMPAVIAFDTAHDRSAVAVVAGVLLPDRRVAVELVRMVPPSLAAEYLVTLRRRHRARLRADAHGPTTSLVDELRAAGTEVDVVTSSRMYAAAARLADAITAGTVTHTGDAMLVASIGDAERRKVGEAWSVARNGPGAAVTVAAALAHDGARAPVARVIVSSG